MARLRTQNTADQGRSKGLFSRWVDELALLLPQERSSASWQGLLIAGHDGLSFYVRDRAGAPRLAGVLSLDGSKDIAKGGDTKQIARFVREPKGLVLRLAPDDVIEKTLNVPADAQDVIGPIVQNQIEMISPWPVEKALFDWAILPSAQGGKLRAGAGGSMPQLNVRVAVAGKAAVSRLVEIAERHGLQPKIADYGDIDAGTTRLNFLREGHQATVRGRGVVQAFLLIVGLAALSVGGLGLLQGLQKREALSWIDERVTVAERRATAAQTVTGQAAQLEARYRLASDEKYRRQPSVGVLEAVSRALPDGTWLTRLELRKGQIRLVGQSGNATALIGQLEASPFFEAVRFVAPVTPGPGGQTFVIEAVASENLDVAGLLNQQLTANSVDQPNAGRSRPRSER